MGIIEVIGRAARTHEGPGEIGEAVLAALEAAGYAVVQMPRTVGEILSPREREVAQMIAVGMSNKEIAKQFGISPRTVEAHCLRVMQKVGAKNRVALASIMARR